MATEKESQKEKRPTAQKRELQNEKRRLRNKAYRSRVKTAIRHLEEGLKNTSPATQVDLLNTVYSLMDKGVSKGIYKLNTASRTKARLAARLGAQ